MNEMKLTKAQVKELNRVAQEDFPKAQAMLDGINLVLGTDYGWLAKEVVWFETHDKENVAERYAHCHDAYAWAAEDDRVFTGNDLLRGLQSRFDFWLEEREKFGDGERLVQKHLDQLVYCKDYVEYMIGKPVNLTTDGKVTVGY